MLTEEVMILRRATRAEKAEQVKRAAFLFARMTRDAEEIAAALQVSSRTVQRMIHLSPIPSGVGPPRLPGRAAFSQSRTGTAQCGA